MAYSFTPYHSNTIVGIPGVGADVDITQIDANQKFAIGTKFTRQDGNEYVYGYSEAGAAIGKVMAQKFASASKTLISNAIIAPASAVAVAGDTVKPGAVGSKFVEITLAAVTIQNNYAGGYFVALSGTGLAQTFRIKSSTKTGDPASGDIRIGFYEAITTAFDTTTDVVIIGNPFNDLVVADGTNYVVAGVAVSTTTTAKPYGWFLRKGITAALQDNTTTALAAGKGVQLSAGVAGAVSIYGNASTDVATLRGLTYLGRCVAISTDTNYAVVDFNL